jgi:hypothetical protein
MSHARSQDELLKHFGSSHRSAIELKLGGALQMTLSNSLPPNQDWSSMGLQLGSLRAKLVLAGPG